MPPIKKFLTGFSFAITDCGSDVRALITKYGGTVSAKITKTVRFVLVSETIAPGLVVSAGKHEQPIPILDVKFLHDSVAARGLQNHEDYLFKKRDKPSEKQAVINKEKTKKEAKVKKSRASKYESPLDSLKESVVLPPIVAPKGRRTEWLDVASDEPPLPRKAKAAAQDQSVTVKGSSDSFQDEDSPLDNVVDDMQIEDKPIPVKKSPLKRPEPEPEESNEEKVDNKKLRLTVSSKASSGAAIDALFNTVDTPTTTVSSTSSKEVDVPVLKAMPSALVPFDIPTSVESLKIAARTRAKSPAERAKMNSFFQNGIHLDVDWKDNINIYRALYQIWKDDPLMNSNVEAQQFCSEMKTVAGEQQSLFRKKLPKVTREVLGRESKPPKSGQVPEHLLRIIFTICCPNAVAFTSFTREKILPVINEICDELANAAESE